MFHQTEDARLTAKFNLQIIPNYSEQINIYIYIVIKLFAIVKFAGFQNIIYFLYFI